MNQTWKKWSPSPVPQIRDQLLLPLTVNFISVFMPQKCGMTVNEGTLAAFCWTGDVSQLVGTPVPIMFQRQQKQST